MSNRPTIASLSARQDGLEATLAQILEAVTAPKHTTATAVAEKVAEPTAPAAPEVKSASDQLKDFAESSGWAFARGGRVELGLVEMKALSRVLKTGSPEIITVGKKTIAVGRTEDGQRAFTQNLYKPEAK